MNRRSLAVAAAVALSVLATPALPTQAADEGDRIVRARALNLRSADKDETGLDLRVNDEWFPEPDIGCFPTPYLAPEAILPYPQKHTVNSTAVGRDIGTFKHLPPTLAFQYHVTAIPGFRPCVGAGLNDTSISDVHILDGAVGLKHSSDGRAARVGADIPVGGGWLANLDVKKVEIGTNVDLNSAGQGKFNVDLLLVSVGFGERFRGAAGPGGARPGSRPAALSASGAAQSPSRHPPSSRRRPTARCPPPRGRAGSRGRCGCR